MEMGCDNRILLKDVHKTRTYFLNFSLICEKSLHGLFRAIYLLL